MEINKLLNKIQYSFSYVSHHQNHSPFTFPHSTAKNLKNTAIANPSKQQIPLLCIHQKKKKHQWRTLSKRKMNTTSSFQSYTIHQSKSKHTHRKFSNAALKTYPTPTFLIFFQRYPSFQTINITHLSLPEIFHFFKKHINIYNPKTKPSTSLQTKTKAIKRRKKKGKQRNKPERMQEQQ